MKKIILSGFLLVCFAVVQAQSVEQGIKQIYYGRYQSAANTLKAVVQQNPNDAEAWYWLTNAFLQQDAVEETRNHLHKAPVTVNDQPFYKVAYGSLLLNENKGDSAALFFDAALKDTKEKNPAILSAVARAHINAKEGNGEYAVDLVQKAIKKDKKNARLYVLLGNAYRKLNKGSEAFEAYKEALDKDDQLASAYYRLGKIFVTQKNADVYLDYFNKAVAADKKYAPAYYELYHHYFFHDPAKAMKIYKQYQSLSDHSIANDYAYTDLLYLNKNYTEAIQNANKLMDKEKENIEPRMYKLLAYSYAGLKDTTKAISYMQQYFTREADSNFVIKDFETMADLYAAADGMTDSSYVYYERAAAMEKDPEAAAAYYKKMATLAQSLKDYPAQAKWLGQYYANSKNATNVDLFNWGLAQYLSENFTQADSIFGVYVEKYPEQGYGYYWQARSNAALDKEMKDGLAVPYYKKLIEVMGKDSTDANYKKWLVEAYAYLAAYATNTQKDYAEAVDYFEKLLQIDPENSDAKKYINILEKNLANRESK
ncbi:MAG: tetratricopeptide repeat protein [Flavisolibacter sp.]|nr:tetratricopeptide repeat protein [Flavisolibacter sp.]